MEETGDSFFSFNSREPFHEMDELLLLSNSHPPYLLLPPPPLPRKHIRLHHPQPVHAVLITLPHVGIVPVAHLLREILLPPSLGHVFLKRLVVCGPLACPGGFVCASCLSRHAIISRATYFPLVTVRDGCFYCQGDKFDGGESPTHPARMRCPPHQAGRRLPRPPTLHRRAWQWQGCTNRRRPGRCVYFKNSSWKSVSHQSKSTYICRALGMWGVIGQIPYRGCAGKSSGFGSGRATMFSDRSRRLSSWLSSIARASSLGRLHPGYMGACEGESGNESELEGESV